MKKSFAIPYEVTESLKDLENADRGMVYAAIYDFVYNHKDPDESISPAARAAYNLAMIILRPLINRHQKAEERFQKRIAEKNIPNPPREMEGEELVKWNETVHKVKEIKALTDVIDYARSQFPDQNEYGPIVDHEFERRYPEDIVISYDIDGSCKLRPKDAA